MLSDSEKSLTTNVKQDSKTEFSWFLWNWEADQEFLWIQDKWHSFRTVLSWSEKLSQEFGIWNRGAIQWAWTINSVKLTQTQTDTAASPGKCWSQTSNESRFFLFCLFFFNFIPVSNIFFRFCFVYSRTIFLFTKSNIYPCYTYRVIHNGVP